VMNKRGHISSSLPNSCRENGSSYARAAFQFNAAFVFSGYFTNGRLYSS
jgi:hypothetical protein